MQINKLKTGSWIGNLVKHAKHDKIRKQWEQTAVSMKPPTSLTFLLRTPDFCLRIRQRTIALSDPRVLLRVPHHETLSRLWPINVRDCSRM